MKIERRLAGVTALLLFPLRQVHADSYETLLRRYEKQIHRQEKQMKSLRSQLEGKEREVSRWRGKAEEAKAAWSEASVTLEQTRGQVKLVRQKRQQVRILADAAQWKSTENILLARSAATEAGALARELYARSLVPKATRGLSVDESAPEAVLPHVARLSASSLLLAQEAQAQETALRTEEMRWQTEEQSRSQESDRLHQKQETLWLKWQEAQRRKTALEEEISQIDQSAKALQVMLQELRDHRDQARALRENRFANDQALASLRGMLPWPAQGKVVQNFGRQYSDGLNQLVVSNGIKISAGAGHTVRSIQEGKVLFANAFRQYGQLVIVQHKNGLTSVYAGLGQTRGRDRRL